MFTNTFSGFESRSESAYVSILCDPYEFCLVHLFVNTFVYTFCYNFLNEEIFISLLELTLIYGPYLLKLFFVLYTVDKTERLSWIFSRRNILTFSEKLTLRLVIILVLNQTTCILTRKLHPGDQLTRSCTYDVFIKSICTECAIASDTMYVFYWDYIGPRANRSHAGNSIISPR